FLNSINLFSQEFIIENYNYSGFHNFFLKCDSLKDSFSGRRLIKTQFKNDSIYIYLDYVDGKKIKATGYFKNGKKYRETNYDGRHLNGSDSRYYKDGQIEFRLQYNHGSKIPPMIYWYEDGRIKTISNISEDNNGTSLEFYPNGNIHIIETAYPLRSSIKKL
ncbi:MAG: hypothetical protein KAI45_03405, partial [Melioribacteraceae bacterium]|nr:hypothetical protein [Melioribacteraceae bacterium]